MNKKEKSVLLIIGTLILLIILFVLIPFLTSLFINCVWVGKVGDGIVVHNIPVTLWTTILGSFLTVYTLIYTIFSYNRNARVEEKLRKENQKLNEKNLESQREIEEENNKKNERKNIQRLNVEKTSIATKLTFDYSRIGKNET